jgi:hypothetical protein
MNLRISSSIVCLSLALGLTARPALAMDNAFIQEWAKEKAGSQPRLMPAEDRACDPGECHCGGKRYRPAGGCSGQHQRRDDLQLEPGPG